MEDGEPIGAYFIAKRGGEGILLRIMAAWEKAFGARPLPPVMC
jgi:amidase